MNILKKRTIQKISAAGIAMAVVCTITTPICCMAEITDHRNSATLAEVGEGTYQTDVYAYQESSYNVTLPKTIILNGITNITNKINAGEYSVNVNGNINGAEIVNVIPKSNVRHINTHHDSDTAEGDGTYSCTDLNENEVQFYMGQTNKNDIKATVNQTKTEFNVSELIDNKTAATTGTITTKLTAGSWKGAFNFDISLKEKDANYSTAIKSWDVSRDTTNGDNVTMTYYAQEGANLSADTYEGGTLVFSGHGRMIGDIE